MVGDPDGVVIIRPNEAEDLIERTRKHNEKEQSIIQTINEKGTFDRPWVDESLDRLKVTYFDYMEY